MLKQELDTNRKIYDNLLQRMKEVGIVSGIVSNNISIIDQALVPGYPFGSGKFLNGWRGLVRSPLPGPLPGGERGCSL